MTPSSEIPEGADAEAQDAAEASEAAERGQRSARPSSLPTDLLPPDHVDRQDAASDADVEVVSGRLGPIGWARWFWRQLTSMRTALFLLLLLALAAVPGSLVPQHTSDPNGVTQFQAAHPHLTPILDKLQVFDTYTSIWFSAIYLLLFVSLIGCIIPRVQHHVQAMLAQPPKTPFRLTRMGGYRQVELPEGVTAAEAVASARRLLKASGYRTVVFDDAKETSVSAERGYLRETGNLVFHIALLGVLVTVGVGGSFGWTAQRVVTVGQTFVNTAVNYDSYTPGRFVQDERLPAYKVTLDSLDVAYEDQNVDALGQPLDYDAHVTATKKNGKTWKTDIKVNHPLRIDGTNVYLLGNGYAPELTFRDPSGHVVSTGATPFLPGDADLTSQGVVKIANGLAKQIGVAGIFMPTAPASTSAMPRSSYPGLKNPRLSLTVYAGDLGLDTGVPQSVYALDTDGMTQLAGPQAKTPGLNLVPGQTVELPGGLGTVTFDGVVRFASLDIHHDPTQGWVLVFAILILAGLLTSLFVPRRRMWVKAKTDRSGRIVLEYAGLARGEDPRLDEAVAELAERHQSGLNSVFISGKA